VRKVLNIIMALVAVAFIYWVYDHYLKAGSVDITLVTKEEGEVVYCRYCKKVISSDIREVRVTRREAPQHRVTRREAVCSACQAKGYR
jgi:hypothetical protein